MPIKLILMKAKTCLTNSTIWTCCVANHKAAMLTTCKNKGWSDAFESRELCQERPNLDLHGPVPDSGR